MTLMIQSSAATSWFDVSSVTVGHRVNVRFDDEVATSVEILHSVLAASAAFELERRYVVT